MRFEDWWEKEVLPLNDSSIYKAGLKVAWNAAQALKQVQIDALKELLINEAQPEIKLLRAVYMDARAVMLLNKDRIAPSVANSLECAIGCVERFDER